MPGDRIAKVNALITTELGQLMKRLVEFPLGTIVTISKVDTAIDLSVTRVWISVLPIEQVEAVEKILAKQRGELQHYLNRKLVMKFVPHIEFHIDYTEEKAFRVESLLDDIAEKE